MGNEKSNTISLHSSQRAMPKYELLREHIIAEMKAGRLQPGDALPSELEMASQLSVARNTVRQALNYLDRDGFINRIRGKGTFVQKNVHKLLTRKRGLLALVMPESNIGHYPAVQKGFERSAAAEHAQVIVSTTDSDPTRQGNAILHLLSQEVAGVAIEPADMAPFTPPYQIEMLQKQGIPVVFYHRNVEGVHAPLVSIPHLEVGRMAGRELVRHGHRRVAMFYTLPSYKAMPLRSGRSYLIGLREVLRQAGGDLPEDFVLSGQTDTLDVGTQEKEIWPQIKKLFSRPDRPTAVMTSYDSMGEIVYLALQRLGLRVPEDVSIISFGGKQRQGAIVNRLTSIVVDGADIGHRANQLLNEMCASQRSIHDTEEIVMPLSLSNGITLGQAPKLP